MRQVVVTPIYEDSEAASRLFVELRKTLGPDLHVVAGVGRNFIFGDHKGFVHPDKPVGGQLL